MLAEAQAVSFFLPGEPELARLEGLDPDAEPHELLTGERAWVLQTYLHLRSAGMPVALVDRVPRAGVVVFHAKHKLTLYRERRASQQALWVAIRGDRHAVATADVEVLQNGCDADGGRRFFLPHWPQPGLVPRDPARGDAFTRVAFKGFSENLHPTLRDPAWAAALAARGFEWVFDAAPFAAATGSTGSLDWASYHQVDAVVALRPARADLHPTKPATKLVNAWLAGVPALIGPEIACRELRRGPLDYLEVTSPEEALQALGRLREDGDLRRAMITNGRRRAEEYQRGRLVERWRELLFERVSAAKSNGERRHRLGLRATVDVWWHQLRAAARGLSA